MRNSNQILPASSQLLSIDSIDVVRVRSSDSTEPVNVSSASHKQQSQQQGVVVSSPPRNSTKSPATTLGPKTPPRELSSWRCKESSSIFRSTTPVDVPDFFSIERSLAFDEDDAEF
eukprot:CAMPEP_0178736274 /NCGR_PEP_ID=MMETSP0744-20121128/2348_1 /TAXON_ID=913974 /ORGANISM="Nitzschia punctata, Strain CCMP561" /LENGTH=115 /DNA_ID=CAMNT_0020388727 /DNA_START=82 /DNA_END=429 /DNA_ORIENTATION=-